VIPKEQVPLLGRAALQVLFEMAKSPESIPVIAMPDIFKSLPVFVIVVLSGSLAAPTATAPKLKLLGNTATGVAHAVRPTTAGIRKPPLEPDTVIAPLLTPA
jgi:hypothetical protein